MKDKYICKQDAIRAVDNTWWNARDIRKDIVSLEPTDVLPYSISNDGTLTVTVPKGIKKIGRILIEEDGTRYGGLFYPDTGGCFLSSMEKEHEHTD